MDRYFVFRKLMDFMSEEGTVVDADMSNYAGDIEITGIDKDGVRVTITVGFTEGKKDGN
jgi:hypothetical protein